VRSLVVGYRVAGPLLRGGQLAAFCVFTRFKRQVLLNSLFLFWRVGEISRSRCSVQLDDETKIVSVRIMAFCHASRIPAAAIRKLAGVLAACGAWPSTCSKRVDRLVASFATIV
jgi:hypothetical protein